MLVKNISNFNCDGHLKTEQNRLCNFGIIRQNSTVYVYIFLFIKTFVLYNQKSGLTILKTNNRQHG